MKKILGTFNYKLGNYGVALRHYRIFWLLSIHFSIVEGKSILGVFNLIEEEGRCILEGGGQGLSIRAIGSLRTRVKSSKSDSTSKTKLDHQITSPPFPFILFSLGMVVVYQSILSKDHHYWLNPLIVGFLMQFMDCRQFELYTLDLIQCSICILPYLFLMLTQCLILI